MVDNLNTLYTNSFNISVNMSQRVLHGQRYLVAPATVARQVVMNSIYTPANELEKSVSKWNDVPVTINHPKNEIGSHVSARDGGVIIGFTQNARMDGDKLKMDIWVNEEKIQGYPKIKSIIEGAKSGGTPEVSTGFYSDSHKNQSNGNYKGRNYTHIHKNIIPDHLAILTSEEGACSNKDGCGINVNQEINNCNCGGVNECACPSKRGVSMEKKEMVDALIANQSNAFDETDREFLEKMSDEKLHSHMDMGAIGGGEGDKSAQQNPAYDGVDKNKKKKKKNMSENKDGEYDYMAPSQTKQENMGDHYNSNQMDGVTQEFLAAAVAEYKNKISSLKQSIVSNSKKDTQDDISQALEGLSVNQLEALNKNIGRGGNAAYALNPLSVVANSSDAEAYKPLETMTI